MMKKKTMMTLVCAVFLSACAALTAQEVPGKENPPPGPPGPPGPPPPHMGMKSPHDRFMEKLTDAEREEVEKLAREKKVTELRKKMRELFQKYRSEEDKKVSLLSDKYLAARTDEEKEAVRKELEAAVRAQFAKRMEFTKRSIAENEEMLKRAQKRLAMLKEHYERNQKNTEEIVRMRVKWLCTPKEERRKMRPPRDRKGPPPGEKKAPPMPGERSGDR